MIPDVANPQGKVNWATFGSTSVITVSYGETDCTYVVMPPIDRPPVKFIATLLGD